MKEYLFQIKKKLKRLLALQQRKLSRLKVNTTLTKADSFNIPIIINNRNRFTYLKQLVDFLISSGYSNISILDNDSDFEPLLDYYKVTPAKVIYLKKNLGYKALWKSDVFESIKKGYYVYTDADLIPEGFCPKDFIYQLYLILNKYPAEKCGPALKIDDLPAHYKHREKVIANELPFWKVSPEKDVYIAPIDTTFALYKPFAFGDAEECEAIRVAGDLLFIHQPWYEDSENPDEETRYYVNHSSDSSFWYKKVDISK